ncbi:Protein of unknown function [Pyronema omphalodes CBS 100304]|uniref:Uncharacterized protein n=1 Tax=Pyronema omphalodes (strain CBS 100304) TaxID=1076935 RepID=U4LB71_PYROM|nr:Protein of unknown function [Pyronema omphalodes CBS 100304]
MLQPIRRVPLRSCSLSRKPFFAPKTQYRTIKHDSSNQNAEGNETYESVKERFKRMKLYYKSLSKSEPTPDISEAREKDQQVTNSYHYTLAADQLAQLSKEMKDFRGLTTDQASKLPKKLEKVEKELTNTKTAVLELATNQLAQLSKEIEGFRG